MAGIAADIPELEVDDPDGEAELLVVGWGSTYGPIGAAIRRVRKRGVHVAHAHLHHLNPFPRNTGDVLKRYRKVLVPGDDGRERSHALASRATMASSSSAAVSGLPRTFV